MNEQYLKLFKEIANTIETLAEDSLKSNNENAAANEMKERYSALYNLLQDGGALSRNDFISILIGVTVIVNRIKAHIESEKKVIDNYEALIIPKLNRVILETSNDEEAIKKAKVLFK